jgi:siroheme synthase
VTHRGAAGAFLVVSGHDLAAFDRSVGGITPEGAGGLTLVVLMGVAKRRDLADVLLKKTGVLICRQRSSSRPGPPGSVCGVVR